MKFEIDKEIIDKTTECKKNFACLSGKTDGLCKIKHTNQDIILIKCDEKKICSYKEDFMSLKLCTCPIRQEIYKKYKT